MKASKPRSMKKEKEMRNESEKLMSIERENELVSLRKREEIEMEKYACEEAPSNDSNSQMKMKINERKRCLDSKGKFQFFLFFYSLTWFSLSKRSVFFSSFIGTFFFDFFIFFLFFF